MPATRKNKNGYSIFVQVTPQFEKIWHELKDYIMPSSDAELFRTVVKEYYKQIFGEAKLKENLLKEDGRENG